MHLGKQRTSCRIVQGAQACEQVFELRLFRFGRSSKGRVRCSDRSILCEMLFDFGRLEETAERGDRREGVEDLSLLPVILVVPSPPLGASVAGGFLRVPPLGLDRGGVDLQGERSSDREDLEEERQVLSVEDITTGPRYSRHVHAGDLERNPSKRDSAPGVCEPQLGPRSPSPVRQCSEGMNDSSPNIVLYFRYDLYDRQLHVRHGAILACPYAWR